MTSWCCLYTNARSLRSKVDELTVTCNIYQPKLIGITESWLDPRISDGEIQLSGFTLYRRDRVDRNGGGSALHVSSEVPCRVISINDTVEDSLFCEIRPTSTTCALVGVIYRPPQSDLSKVCNNIRRVVTRRYTNVLLVSNVVA